ncbi:cytidine deaminase-like protein [Truncatella angustata]|uniref:Cytidine deaminase-like protein n=1 Tax=Truncatella angustata TaxID=152316 RepID=A0A9P8U816_9PEZI|nr:cytidine deaminase-like protein [Truncatella angustata]KAH6643318.1 cytidine deaminase-like protein [Truncatella angustata]KAH8197847.1 hypothetical protein TruAng_007994 [Truncatella angustata]
MADSSLGPDELSHLRRCVALAAEAVEAGDAPFGSVLVDRKGTVLQEERNRIVTQNDSTRHPEFDLARWAAANMSASERAGATVYTSGEHCPMCSAAHAWVGLGRIVYVASAAQLVEWQSSWGLPKSSVAPLPAEQVAPQVKVEGPVPELEDDIRALHRKHAGV